MSGTCWLRKLKKTIKVSSGRVYLITRIKIPHRNAIWSEATSHGFLVSHLKVVRRFCQRKSLCLCSNSKHTQQMWQCYASASWCESYRWDDQSIPTHNQTNNCWQSTCMYSHYIKVYYPTNVLPDLLLASSLCWDGNRLTVGCRSIWTPASLSQIQYYNTPCTFVRQSSY